MAKAPKHRYIIIGKGKVVHLAHNEAYDRKHSGCQQLRKATVAGKVPAGGMSPEAASALKMCEDCGVPERVKADIEASKTAEERRAESEDRMRTTLENAKPKTAKSKKEPRSKAAKKESKPKAASKPTKAGTRSTGGGDHEKANALAAFAMEHGWSAVTEDADPGVRLVATKDGETVRCYFVDGKYDTVRHATVSVGSWTGKLRGVHGCRNQMALEGRDRPHPQPGAGRSRPKSKKEDATDVVPEDESPEDAAKRVPFLVDDEPAEIIDAIAGKVIRWRMEIGAKGVTEARVPSKSKRTTITTHPKNGRRILSFLSVAEDDHGHEVLGGERSVALDKIIRVIG